jgi:hypothetical protein
MNDLKASLNDTFRAFYGAQTTCVECGAKTDGDRILCPACRNAAQAESAGEVKVIPVAPHRAPDLNEIIDEAELKVGEAGLPDTKPARDLARVWVERWNAAEETRTGRRRSIRWSDQHGMPVEFDEYLDEVDAIERSWREYKETAYVARDVPYRAKVEAGRLVRLFSQASSVYEMFRENARKNLAKLRDAYDYPAELLDKVPFETRTEKEWWNDDEDQEVW